MINKLWSSPIFSWGIIHKELTVKCWSIGNNCMLKRWAKRPSDCKCSHFLLEISQYSHQMILARDLFNLIYSCSNTHRLIHSIDANRPLSKLICLKHYDEYERNPRQVSTNFAITFPLHLSSYLFILPQRTLTYVGIPLWGSSLWGSIDEAATKDLLLQCSCLDFTSDA